MSDLETFLLLHDGYPISKSFFDRVQQQLEERLPTLKRYKRYKAQPLLGDAFWDAMNNGERRMAGRCLAHIVARKLVPLHFAKSNHEYPKWYQLN